MRDWGRAFQAKGHSREMRESKLWLPASFTPSANVCGEMPVYPYSVVGPRGMIKTLTPWLFINQSQGQPAESCCRQFWHQAASDQDNSRNCSATGSCSDHLSSAIWDRNTKVVHKETLLQTWELHSAIQVLQLRKIIVAQCSFLKLYLLNVNYWWLMMCPMQAP